MTGNEATGLHPLNKAAYDIAIVFKESFRKLKQTCIKGEETKHHYHHTIRPHGVSFVQKIIKLDAKFRIAGTLFIFLKIQMCPILNNSTNCLVPVTDMNMIIKVLSPKMIIFIIEVYSLSLSK